MKIVLYQPDIPQNLGTTLRTAACLGIDVEIIEPCGFPLDDKKLRRSGMDYIDLVKYTRHISWEEFASWHKKLPDMPRIILLTTKAQTSYTDFMYKKNDILLFGRETSGIPEEIHKYADHRLTIKMQPGIRSLNVAVSVAMVAGEAIRQINLFNPCC